MLIFVAVFICPKSEFSVCTGTVPRFFFFRSLFKLFSCCNNQVYFDTFFPPVYTSSFCHTGYPQTKKNCHIHFSSSFIPGKYYLYNKGLYVLCPVGSLDE